MRVLFLDIDGVLNRTGFFPQATVGMRSWIEPELAARLVAILETIDAKIVLSTSCVRSSMPRASMARGCST